MFSHLDSFRRNFEPRQCRELFIEPNLPIEFNVRIMSFDENIPLLIFLRFLLNLFLYFLFGFTVDRFQNLNTSVFIIFQNYRS
jgi:hypothetical protein